MRLFFPDCAPINTVGNHYMDFYTQANILCVLIYCVSRLVCFYVCTHWVDYYKFSTGALNCSVNWLVCFYVCTHYTDYYNFVTYLQSRGTMPIVFLSEDCLTYSEYHSRSTRIYNASKRELGQKRQGIESKRWRREKIAFLQGTHLDSKESSWGIATLVYLWLQHHHKGIYVLLKFFFII